MHHIIINGFDTSTIKDAYVTDLGKIKASLPRISESAEIYGANHVLDIEDGAYDGYDREFEIVVKRMSDIVLLSSKFNKKDNELIFSYDTESKFFCDLKDITYEPLGNHYWKIDIKVRMHPFRYMRTVPDITLTQRGTIENIGNVYSEPIIEIEGTGSVTLTIGSQIMNLELDTKARIDCRHLKQNVYDKNGRIKNTIRKRGPFFQLPVGRTGVTSTGNITRITIKGNWRYTV